MKILAKTFRFDKGQLQVILLPEEPQYCNLTVQDQCEEYNVWLGTLSRYGCKCRALEIAYNEAVAYARAHPIPVREEDEQKIEDLLWKRYVREGMWGLQDHTDYKLSGVGMEIKEVNICKTCNEQGLRNCGYFDECGAWETKQVACLIEDDKQ